MSTSFGWALKSLYSHGATSNVQGCQRHILIQKLYVGLRHSARGLSIVKRSRSNLVTIMMTPLYKLS